MGQQQQQEGPVAMEEDLKMETTAEDSRHLQHGFSPDYLKLYYGKLCVFLASPPSLPPYLPCVFFLPSSLLSFVIPLFSSASKQVSKEGKTKRIVNEEIVCTSLDRSCPSRTELHVVLFFFFSLFLWML
jgi:hypothetical protein